MLEPCTAREAKAKEKTRANEAWAKQASSAATARSVDIPKRSAPCFTQSSERKEPTTLKKKQRKKQIADYWKHVLLRARTFNNHQ